MQHNIDPCPSNAWPDKCTMARPRKNTTKGLERTWISQTWRGGCLLRALGKFLCNILHRQRQMSAGFNCKGRGQGALFGCRNYKSCTDKANVGGFPLTNTLLVVNNNRLVFACPQAMIGKSAVAIGLGFVRDFQCNRKKYKFKVHTVLCGFSYAP